MSEVIRLTKKTFTVGVVIATIAWSLSLASLIAPMAAQGATINDGDLVKASLTTVYYYAAGKRYVFPNEKTYKTWYTNFSGVKTITDAELASYPLAGNVTYRPGVKMVKINTDPKTYAVDKGGKLRWVTSEAIAIALYGSLWNKGMVEDVSDAFWVNYMSGADITVAADFNVSATTAAATSIATDKGLSVVVGGGPVGSGLTVSLAADSPAGATLISDGTNNNTGSSVFNKVMALNFAASSDGDVKVKTLKLKRAGVSADSDIRSMHLQGDDGAYLGEYTSISSGIVTFNNASGLFTVTKGTTKKVWLLMDVGNDAAQGKTWNFTVVSAADVVTDGGAVSGSFPMMSSTSQAASVSDFGRLQLSSATIPSTVDPGTLNKEILRFNVQATNQKLEVRKVKFTEVGTIAYSDLTNLKLMDGGTQIGSTATGLASDGTVTFDLTANPYVMAAGVTRTLSVIADLSSGSINRTFELTVQRYTDMIVWDTNYSANVAADTGTVGSFSVFEGASNISTGSAGKLTVTVRSDSPTGNIIKGATDVELGKWDFAATGEAVKITDLYVFADISDVADGSTGGLDNTKVLVDGVQVGTTADLTEEDAVTFTLGSNFIVPAGATRTVVVKSDTKKSDATAHTTGATMTVSLRNDANGAGGVATGQVSLASVTLGTSVARTLTLQVGTVAASKNQSFADRTSTNVTGVASALGVKVASFIITAGSGEAADITQIRLGDGDSDKAMAEDFQNLKVKDANGNQIGTTVASLNSTASTYTFTPGTAIRLNASQQYVVDVYSDVLSSVTNSATAFVAVKHDKTFATGVTTGSDVSDDSDVNLQQVYLGSSGNLTITVPSDSPDAAQYTLGQTAVTLAKFRFQTDSAEDINVTRVIVSASGTNASSFTGGASGSTGTLKNFKLFDAATQLQVGPTIAALASTNNTITPYADFSGMSMTVTKNNSRVLEVRADFATADEGGTASSSLRLGLLFNYTSDATADESVEARGTQSGTSITAGTLDYGTTPDVDQFANAADAFRSKLSLAFASDSPSGATSPSSEQTIAKLTVSNAANSGNYTALLKNLNPTLSQAGISITANRTAYIYKNTISSANQVGTTIFGDNNDNYDTTVKWFDAASFTDVEVASGGSVTLIVTLDTSDASITDAGTDSLSVKVSAGDVVWDDDNNDGTTRNITVMNSLPLQPKTLTYS